VPIFEYRCDSCQHEFETLVRTGDTPVCPKCAASGLTKLLSLPAIKSESTHGLALRAAK
jgi:putative FmdB family regulatory protein